MKYRIKLVSTCFVEGEINADSIQDAKKILNNPRLTQVELIKGNLYSNNLVDRISDVNVV